MIGIHFRSMALKKHWPVSGLARNSASSRSHGPFSEHIHRCDILDRDALQNVFEKVQPELMIHLAAQAFNGESWTCEETTHRSNYIRTHNVLRSCLKHGARTKALLACSSAAYGDFSAKDCPLPETHPLHPISPYGVSKAASEALGFQYYQNFGLPVYLPRLFIHVRTGHPPATAIQNFARQLALMAKNKCDPVLHCGDLDTARDFIDVRDGVEGMMMMLEKSQPGEPINICSGKSHKIGDILKMLIEISGLHVSIEYDARYKRPSDEPILVGDNSKLKQLGWQQKHTIQQTLERVYADWYERV